MVGAGEPAPRGPGEGDRVMVGAVCDARPLGEPPVLHRGVPIGARHTHCADESTARSCPARRRLRRGSSHEALSARSHG
jgi:hypothetical protein